MAGEPVVLEYARDIIAHFERDGADGLVGQVRGIVTDRKNEGSRAQIVELVDVSGTITVVFLPEIMLPEDYELSKAIRKGDIVRVSGPVDYNRAGRLSIFPTVPPQSLRDATGIPIEQTDLPFRAAGSKLLHARIIRRITDHLDGADFVEIEPKYLSVTWQGYGLEPIKASYPGFGLNIYLTPSPLPQMFEVLISTDERRIYSVGKCFSTSYRDTRSSTESTSVFCIERLDIRHAPIDGTIWSSAMRNLTELFGSIATRLLDDPIDLNNPRIIDSAWPLSSVTERGLFVQRCLRPSIPMRERSQPASAFDEAEIEEYARVVLSRGTQQYVLAECSREIRFGALNVVCTTFHTEHILDILSSAPFRALRTSTFWNE